MLAYQCKRQKHNLSDTHMVCNTLRHICRGEQSLSAARSALSPETGKQHEGQLEKTPSQGKDGQPSIGPSVRGMFSDLKRTMERVGEPILPKHKVAPCLYSGAWYRCIPS